MEIEPEKMNPHERPRSSPLPLPGKWQMMLWGSLALIIGGALLFFMFWIALFFVALGLVFFVINRIRSWIRGEKPGENSSASVRFYIGRGPPGA